MKVVKKSNGLVQYSVFCVKIIESRSFELAHVKKQLVMQKSITKVLNQSPKTAKNAFFLFNTL